ncbi:DnaA regulatory inactivator Hda [Brumicola pallidula]|uniref:DnaA-homolog protein n=1 Tax=Brumicola pallidula DSM 14239 = ACAM 615 TaxID=1121922 RepID=K7A1I0_9ALTE|nr:DnaA regulatory inactivator Hda [Glaciecola pallidula]GAC29355.1 DnaA-homolog protein [Glaciecola pallidula DSM 14239 = ACAM 615]
MQLSLPVSLPDDETFDSFLEVDNEFAASYLKAFCDHGNNSNKSLCYLFGASGVGKSHLLFACCHQATLNGLQTVYLNMLELKEMPTQVISDIADYDVICIDNLHEIAGHQTWERTLFDLINQAVERSHQPRLIMAANASPLVVGFQLPDLISRLTWGAVFQLASRSDKSLCDIIQFRIEHRGLEASEDCIKFLLTRVDRELSNLMLIVDELDKKSLQAKRKLTIPFIKQALNL